MIKLHNEVFLKRYIFKLNRSKNTGSEKADLQILKVHLHGKFFLQIHFKLYMCTDMKYKFDSLHTWSNPLDGSIEYLKGVWVCD
jgi:hypothetical protein